MSDTVGRAVYRSSLRSQVSLLCFKDVMLHFFTKRRYVMYFHLHWDTCSLTAVHRLQCVSLLTVKRDLETVFKKRVLVYVDYVHLFVSPSA